MAELTISADEIRSAIENYVSEYSPDVSREEVGRVTETGDGIARVEGLPSAMTNELLEFEGGVLGLALNLDVREIGVRHPRRRLRTSRRASRSAAPARSSPCRSATASSAASSTRWATRSTARATIETTERRAARAAGAHRGAAPAGEGAAADRHQGHRRHDRRSAAASAS